MSTKALTTNIKQKELGDFIILVYFHRKYKKKKELTCMQ